MTPSLAAALEIAGLSLALAAANAAFAAGDPGFMRVEPHPFFALVAIVALRHGALGGLGAGLAAGAVHAALGHGAIAAPLLLVGTGAALGIVASRERARAAGAEEDARRARAERDALLARAAAEERARLALERRALEPAARVARLAEATARLATLEEKDLFAAIAGLLADHLEAESAAVYALEASGRLRRRATRGEAEGPEERDPGAGLVGLALRERRVVSARDLPGADALLAAPLIAANGALLGAFEVRAMPFVSLTASAERVAALLADWSAHAWERARGGGPAAPAAHEPAPPDRDATLGLPDEAYLATRLAEEIARARRQKEPLSLLVLALEDWDHVAPGARQAVRRATAAVLLGALRGSDSVFRYKEERSFAAVLSAASADGAERAERRIVDALEGLALEPYRRPDGGDARLRFRFGRASFGEGAASPAELMAAAERALAAKAHEGARAPSP